MTDTSAYPGALDGDLKAITTAHVTAPPGAIDFLELVADAVAKIETELGTNPSGAAATVAAAIASALTAAGTSYAGGTGISATDVEGALDELATEKLDTATAAATYAPLISPALTGTPTVPTAAAGTDTTQAASTAFVKGAVDNATSGATEVVRGPGELHSLASGAWAFADGVPCWQIAPIDDIVSGSITVPDDWTAVNVRVRWSKETANNGDVKWRCDVGSFTVGDVVSRSLGSAVTATAPATQRQVTETTIRSGFTVTAGDTLVFNVIRLGAGNTLTGDINVHEVIVENANP